MMPKSDTAVSDNLERDGDAAGGAYLPLLLLLLVLVVGVVSVVVEVV